MSRIEQNRFLATCRDLAVAVAVLCGAVVARAEVLQPSADAGANTDAIQAAIDAASAAGGGTVELAEGAFTITNCIEVKAGVTLKGADWEKTILKQTVKLTSCLKIDGASDGLPAAKVEHLTITGVVDNRGPTANEPGVALYGGVLSHCIVSNNLASNLFAARGAGIHIFDGRSRIDHSIIRKNAQTYFGKGGGIRVASKLTVMPVIDTCLIADNGGGSNASGGGIFCESPIVLVNSTIAGNKATLGRDDPRGGGVYFSGTCYVTNCIFSGNEVASTDGSEGKPNWSGTTPVGANNFFGDGSATFGDNPQSAATASFSDAANGDYTLKATSVAKGTGFWYADIPVDLTGSERPSPVDIGCYRYDSSKAPFSCPASMSVTEAFVDQKVSFETQLVNPPSGGSFTYVWTLTDQFGNERTLADSATPCEAIPAAGFYTVSLEVRDQNSSAKASDKIAETLHIAVRTNYVTSVTTATSVYPYDTPGKAATSIDAAVAEAIGGSTIILDEGTHKLTARVELSKGVRILGSGQEKTIIDASGKQAFALRHVNDLLEDLTITNGDGRDGSNAAISIIGAGGTIRRCRLIGNTSSRMDNGGDTLEVVSAAGLVENCIITNNSSSWLSGQAKTAVVRISSGGTVRNCLIAYNRGSYRGSNVMEGSTVKVEAQGILENCTIVSNSIIGVTAASAALYLPWSSSASSQIGAIVHNVIVADNFATNSTLPETEYISIPNWSSVTKASSLTTISHCAIGDGCATLGTNPADGGKIRFVDAANGDWRLARGSSCYGHGVNEDWMKASVDLDGKPRILGRRVDIGCYEADPNGLMVLVR